MDLLNLVDMIYLVNLLIMVILVNLMNRIILVNMVDNENLENLVDLVNLMILLIWVRSGGSGEYDGPVLNLLTIKVHLTVNLVDKLLEHVH